ncbi:hypothetical protein TSUD_47870 [Trifolium subterraneum]|nr:hypothetical protein TSUD_47870 [Trifolium subterraneum]
MEPAQLIFEEWNSLSGQYTAEEADFMAQFLSCISISTDNSANTFSTTSNGTYSYDLETNIDSLLFCLEDAKLSSQYFDDNLSKQINYESIDHEGPGLETVKVVHAADMENTAKRFRSSIEVSKNMRNVRKCPNSASRRRERINERLRILQTLVPNGTKVDISTMLEEAVQYVKFLQLQIKLLSSEDMWMYAPIAYNGINIGLDLS